VNTGKPLEADTVIRLPQQVTLAEIESNLEALLQAGDRKAASLELNLSQVQSIGAATLVYLISLIVDRADHGFQTCLRLPVSESVRDFLRDWRFQETLLHATGIPLRQLVCAEDPQYFADASRAESRDTGLTPDEAIAGLYMPADFWALRIIPINEVTDTTSLALEESRRWQTPLIKHLLHGRLKGPEEYIATRIAFEAMTNGLRHPNAHMIVTASQLSSHSERSSSSSHDLSIVYWDDGESIVETVRRGRRGGHGQKIEIPANFYLGYRIAVEHPGRITPRRMDVHSLIDEHAPDYELLLAATLPGVGGSVLAPTASSRAAADTSFSSVPGMGLFMLVNTTVDVLGGTLHFRTGRLRVKIQADRNGRTANGFKYNARVHEFDDQMPSFRGNLIIAQVPVSLPEPSISVPFPIQMVS
jgi:hypothetical protein